MEQQQQYVGIDLHRRRSVIVRRNALGETLDTVRIDNDPVALAAEVSKAGPHPEVILEATYGWYWAADVLTECGATVHLSHPLGNNWGNRRVKNDERDATDLVDLLRLGRLAEAWIAPPPLRELREYIRYRAKLVQLRSNLKAQVHSVFAKEGVTVPMTDLFGVKRTPSAQRRAAGRRLPAPGHPGCPPALPGSGDGPHRVPASAPPRGRSRIVEMRHVNGKDIPEPTWGLVGHEPTPHV